jgi:hypothetical protein
LRYHGYARLDVLIHPRELSARPLAARALFTVEFALGDHDSTLGQLFHTPYDVSPDGESGLRGRVCVAAEGLARFLRCVSGFGRGLKIPNPYRDPKRWRNLGCILDDAELDKSTLWRYSEVSL